MRSGTVLSVGHPHFGSAQSTIIVVTHVKRKKIGLKSQLRLYKCGLCRQLYCLKLSVSVLSDQRETDSCKNTFSASCCWCFLAKNTDSEFVCDCYSVYRVRPFSDRQRALRNKRQPPNHLMNQPCLLEINVYIGYT